ncbi:5-dehydro-2-deoxygluconokinase [Clostridiales bacterium COT073_COT-073]|nr:5-dehydro-2-deoxygluconokinase [Clostridiales bacterium COT073_COT-073]
MTEKIFDLICIGRAAVDLNSIEVNCPMEETKSFAKYVGGSPINIAVGAVTLGFKAGFIGKVSDDQLGRYVLQYISEKGIDASGIVVDREGHKIGLTFTEIKSPQECSILMYRNEACDLYLKPEEIRPEYLMKTSHFLISGTALAQSPSREAVLKALQIAKKHKIKTIFELDYRPYNWNSMETVAVYYQLVSEQCEIVIGTRDEYDLIWDNKEKTDNQIASELIKKNAELVVIKHGAKGSKAFDGSGKEYIAQAYKVTPLKTFGAGDSFASAFLYKYLKEKDVESALKYGSASAALVVTRHSCSDAMPKAEEIEEFIDNYSKEATKKG